MILRIRFKDGEFIFTHTNSLLYIILKERYKLTLLTSEKGGNLGSSSGGAIIARKESGITTHDQIRGKKFALGPMLAPTGYLASTICSSAQG